MQGQDGQVPCVLEAGLLRAHEGDGSLLGGCRGQGMGSLTVSGPAVASLGCLGKQFGGPWVDRAAQRRKVLRPEPQGRKRTRAGKLYRELEGE